MDSNCLSLLKRQVSGAKLRKKWVDGLCKDLNVEGASFQFHDLAFSDKIRETARTSFGPRHGDHGVAFAEKRLPNGSYSKSEELFFGKDGLVYIIPLDAEEIGVISTTLKTLSRYWHNILLINPDGFIVVDENCNNKLVLQSIDECLDLAVWGVDWRTRLQGNWLKETEGT